MNTLKYKVMRFPDGEVQVEVTEPINHKEEYTVPFRITSAEELFIADQIMDILDRHEVVYHMDIKYLMGMRMDRVMSFDKPFTLKLVADVFNRHNPSTVCILEPHSSRAIELICNSYSSQDENLSQLLTGSEYQIVLPDRGARDRYQIGDAIICDKVRNIETGKIESLRVINPEFIRQDHLLIVDDLCDGGGTFCGLYDEFMKINPKLTIDLYVTHMVNSAGMERVYNKFNHVYTTNSYYDWSPCSRSTIYNVLA